MAGSLLKRPLQPRVRPTPPAPRNATDAATGSPAAGGSVPVTGGPEAAIALLAITFLAVGGFGIARSQRYAKQHPSHT